MVAVKLGVRGETFDSPGSRASSVLTEEEYQTPAKEPSKGQQLLQHTACDQHRQQPFGVLYQLPIPDTFSHLRGLPAERVEHEVWPTLPRPKGNLKDAWYLLIGEYQREQCYFEGGQPEERGTTTTMEDIFERCKAIFVNIAWLKVDAIVGYHGGQRTYLCGLQRHSAR
ncbi:hypothetical protein BV898_10100 [Hypsibius exemplaris]|uniref:Uncharacterized protein n=1 Tax=Hypsibius exemplaris TaxID=2072580 RepID=A0A1W0WKW4_HYPEX|nr:hypothetical protein BV898_10100 [Hypsibius exemplaris]